MATKSTRSRGADRIHGEAAGRRRGVAVLMGGRQPMDHWEYDGTAWRARDDLALPSPRGDHAMVYDGHRRRIVLFGGVREEVISPLVILDRGAASGPPGKKGEFIIFLLPKLSAKVVDPSHETVAIQDFPVSSITLYKKCFVETKRYVNQVDIFMGGHCRNGRHAEQWIDI